jgi:hypothetical protein
MLEPGPITATPITLNAPQVVDWKGGRLLVISDGSLYDASQPSTPTLIAPMSENWSNPILPPDGTAVVYSNYVVDEQVFEVVSISLLDGTLGSYSTLGDGFNSPALSTIWSQDSQYLAFGISQLTGGGVCLWENEASPTPAPFVSSPDAGYTPNYSFSPDDTRLLMHSSGDLRVIVVDDPLEGHMLGSGMASPGSWSPDGQYVYYAENDMGRLVPVSTSGEFGTPIEVDDMGYGCDAHWIDDRRLLNRACLAGPAPLFLLQIGAGDPPVLTTSTLVDDALDMLDASPDGQCLANWNTDAIRISGIDDVASYDTLRQTATPDIRSLQWAHDSSGVAWVEYGDGVYFQAVAGCSPVGEPILLRSDSTIGSLAFLR